MKVLVDTSVWADFLNGHPSSHAAALAELLAGDAEVCTCGIVVTEVFQGLRKQPGREAIRRSFGDLTFLEVSGMAVYLRAAEVYRLLRKGGHTVPSTVDCVIAAIAEANGCSVLARDRDMDAILASGILATRAWPSPTPGR